MTDLNLCQAAKFPANPYDRCVLTKNPDHKYCPLHMTYDHVIDFVAAPGYINQDASRENITKPYNPTIHKHIIKPNLINCTTCTTCTTCTNCANSEGPTEKKPPMKKKPMMKGKATAPPMKKGNAIIDTKKESSVVEDDTNIRLLILTNNDSYVELVKKNAQKLGQIVHGLFEYFWKRMVPESFDSTIVCTQT